MVRMDGGEILTCEGGTSSISLLLVSSSAVSSLLVCHFISSLPILKSFTFKSKNRISDPDLSPRKSYNNYGDEEDGFGKFQILYFEVLYVYM